MSIYVHYTAKFVLRPHALSSTRLATNDGDVYYLRGNLWA